MRRCNIAAGSCMRSDKPCCVDCPDKGCEARCQNDPARCSCWTDVEPAKQAVLRKWDEIARLHAQGLSQREIAQRVGCGKSTVFNALAKMAGREAEP